MNKIMSFEEIAERILVVDDEEMKKKGNDDQILGRPKVTMNTKINGILFKDTKAVILTRNELKIYYSESMTEQIFTEVTEFFFEGYEF
jgi:hypothetical protein